MLTPILAMHLPDGFLNVPVSLIGWLLTIIIITISLRQTRQQFGERTIPLMGILAACIFAGQMLNFPVGGGTSGHLLGAALAAILLGPYAAVLVMTCVVGVQALLYQDGGLLTLGFNIFNMGVVAAFIGYAAYKWVWRIFGSTPTSPLVGAGVSAWLTIVVASAVCALELAISGTSPLGVALPAMVGIHAVIGIGEALITISAISFIRQTRPDLLNADSTPAATRGSGWIAVGLVIAIVLAFTSPLGSSHPDGLEFIAEQSGFLHLAQNPAYNILPDYTVPFIHDEALTTIVAGVIGVLVVAGTGLGATRLAVKKQKNSRAHIQQTSLH